MEGNEQRVESANVRERKLLQSHDSHMTTISLTLDGSGESRAAFTEMINRLSGWKYVMIVIWGLVQAIQVAIELLVLL